MIPYKQLSLADFFTDCQNKFDNDKYQFLELLDQTINLDEIVPVSFISHFHAATGRPRKHLLYPAILSNRANLQEYAPNMHRLYVLVSSPEAAVIYCSPQTEVPFFIHAAHVRSMQYGASIL